MRIILLLTTISCSALGLTVSAQAGTLSAGLPPLPTQPAQHALCGGPVACFEPNDALTYIHYSRENMESLHRREYGLAGIPLDLKTARLILRAKQPKSYATYPREGTEGVLRRQREQQDEVPLDLQRQAVRFFPWVSQGYERNAFIMGEMRERSRQRHELEKARIIAGGMRDFGRGRE